MAILDGKKVEDEVIDPGKCRFIGMFRELRPLNYAVSVICGCGQTLHTREDIFDHWQSGHFDQPQYVTMEKS